MLFKIYISLSAMVFVLAIGQFWQDPENPKSKLTQWLFLALAMLLSPIVLPNMIIRRLQKNAGAHSINLGKISTPQRDKDSQYSFNRQPRTDDGF